MYKVTSTTKRRPISRVNAPSTAKNPVRDVQTPRSAMAIERVPIEIIDQIFEEYVEMGQSACNLTLISRTWWSLAVANPRLWRYIVVRPFVIWATSGDCCGGYRVLPYPFKDLRHIGPSTRILTRGKAQVCNRDDDFKAAVKRSGSVPLHITYEGDSGTVLKQIMTAPISSRVAVLDIYSERDMQPIMAQITLGRFTQLTELRSKMLRPIEYEKFIKIVRHSAPLLTTLEFRALTDSLLTLPIWETLRTLEFRTISTEHQAFDSMLNRCHHLVKLSIGHSMWPTMGTSLGPGALTNLETVEFRCDIRALSTLDLVNIKSLTILEAVEDGNTLGWQRIHLPKLAVLRITFTHSIQGFKYLDTPLLQDLHITRQSPFNSLNSELLEIFSSLSFPHVTRLYVKAHWDESVFTAVMSVIPNVRKINFIGEKYHDRLVWESVFDKLLPVAGGEPFCPKLESCTLADEEYPAALRRSRLDYFIRAIQTYRKEHAMPKPCFEIYNHYGRSTKVERIEYN